MPKNSSLRPKVGILMGSDSDLEVMREAEKQLDYFGIPYETRILSAHRSVVKTLEYADSAHQRGVEVIVVGAGAAAHLAGVVPADPHLLPAPAPDERASGRDLHCTFHAHPGGTG